MDAGHSCPVCGRQGLSPNCCNCPQCDADLTCFQALDSLFSEQKIVPSENHGSRFSLSLFRLRGLILSEFAVFLSVQDLFSSLSLEAMDSLIGEKFAEMKAPRDITANV